MRPIQPDEQAFTVAATNTTTGATKIVERFECSKAAVHFHSFDGVPGDYDLEGTIDGSTWIKIQSTITAATVVSLSHYWYALRVYTDTAGGAPPTVVFGAYELTW